MVKPPSPPPSPAEINARNKEFWRERGSPPATTLRRAEQPPIPAETIAEWLRPLSPHEVPPKIVRASGLYRFVNGPWQEAAPDDLPPPAAAWHKPFAALYAARDWLLNDIAIAEATAGELPPGDTVRAALEAVADGRRALVHELDLVVQREGLPRRERGKPPDLRPYWQARHGAAMIAETLRRVGAKPPDFTPHRSTAQRVLHYVLAVRAERRGEPPPKFEAVCAAFRDR